MCSDMLRDERRITILDVYGKHRLGAHSKIIVLRKGPFSSLGVHYSVLFSLTHFSIDTTIRIMKTIDQHR